MCCFSGPVEVVADTKIFARSATGSQEGQILVYSMTYAAAADLAMVLPLPVPQNPAEDAVTFINLEGYPEFFFDMDQCFVVQDSESLGGSDLVEGPTLHVHDVGSFEASFVPRIEDFDRLDTRFRLPGQVWDSFPVYRDYGFAVFKLKGSGPGGNGARQVHPMAFVFPRRNPERLFFPTVHVHDGVVHPTAEFDHVLYCQPDERTQNRVGDWRMSSAPASRDMDMRRTNGIVTAQQHVWRMKLFGKRENLDVLIGKDGYVPMNTYIGKTGLVSLIDQKKWKNTMWVVLFVRPWDTIPCYSEDDVERLLAKDAPVVTIYAMTRTEGMRTRRDYDVRELTRADWLAGKR